MKKAITLLLLIAGCAVVSYEGIITEQQVAKIPAGASEVHVSSKKPPGELYNAVYIHLVNRNGFQPARKDQQMGYFSTKAHHMGQGTYIRIQVSVEPTPQGSIAIFRAQFKPDAETEQLAEAMSGTNLKLEWKQSKWEASKRHKASFAYLVSTADPLGATSYK